MSNLIVFAITVASILSVPGPSNTLLATAGAMGGARRSLPLIGCELAGYAIAIGTLTTLGRALLVAFPHARWVLRGVLVVFILLTAFRLWRFAPESQNLDRSAVTPGTVFFTSLLNPKALIFAFAIFPPLTNPSDVFRYGGTFAAVALVIALCWIMFGATAGSLLGQKRVFISRVSAVLLVVFACVAASVV